MGMFMSSLGGLSSTQMLGFVMGTLHKQFVEKDINNFEDFHCAILDIFNTFNSALPGMHYGAPSRKDIQECFDKWVQAPEAERKKLFVEFMKSRMILSKLDDSTMLTGIVTPPAAMAAKRAGENLPQLKIIKHIPDVIFVPSATVLALISAKLTRRMFLGNLAVGGSAAAKMLSHDGQNQNNNSPPPVGKSPTLKQSGASTSTTFAEGS